MTTIAGGSLGGTPSVPGQALQATITQATLLQTPEQFGNVLLKVNQDGSHVRIKDVARVELGGENYNFDTKFNWNRTSAHQIWGKYSQMNAKVSNLFVLGTDGGGLGDTKVYQGTMGHTWTLSSTMILDSTFGVSRQAFPLAGTGHADPHALADRGPRHVGDRLDEALVGQMERLQRPDGAPRFSQPVLGEFQSLLERTVVLTGSQAVQLHVDANERLHDAIVDLPSKPCPLLQDRHATRLVGQAREFHRQRRLRCERLGQLQFLISEGVGLREAHRDASEVPFTQHQRHDQQRFDGVAANPVARRPARCNGPGVEHGDVAGPNALGRIVRIHQQCLEARGILMHAVGRSRHHAVSELHRQCDGVIVAPPKSPSRALKRVHERLQHLLEKRLQGGNLRKLVCCSSQRIIGAIENCKALAPHGRHPLAAGSLRGAGLDRVVRVWIHGDSPVCHSIRATLVGIPQWVFFPKDRGLRSLR